MNLEGESLRKCARQVRGGQQSSRNQGEETSAEAHWGSEGCSLKQRCPSKATLACPGGRLLPAHRKHHQDWVAVVSD